MTKRKEIICWIGVLTGAALLAFAGWHIRSPLLLRCRPWSLPMVLIGCTVLAGIVYRKKSSFGYMNRAVYRLYFIILTAVSITSMAGESGFLMAKYRVMHAPAPQINRLGRHFIVGYRHLSEILPLVKRGAVGGIYITKRNVSGKSMAQVRQEIKQLQDIQTGLELPPLIVAADQEGGIVSRLSPPLTKLPSLGSVVKAAETNGELQKNVYQYAAFQAAELAAIGVTLNLSPVVDLKTHDDRLIFGTHTRLDLRAIAEDRDTVAETALAYCRAMADQGITATLKHFPGLGNVREDTHHHTGSLTQTPEDLSHRDWVPFRRTIQETDAAVMLGHVILKDWDAEHPASFSEKVIQGILRKGWGYDGLLITDDLNMAPAASTKGGIGAAAVKALNAGVDLLLISYDGEQYYPAMDAVIKAEKEGRLTTNRLEASTERLSMVR